MGLDFEVFFILSLYFDLKSINFNLNYVILEIYKFK